jgi:hypothetical protein
MLRLDRSSRLWLTVAATEAHSDNDVDGDAEIT